MSRIAGNDENAFSILFHRYYSALCLFATHFLQDDEQSRELVQELFVQLWEKRRQIRVHRSVKSYLFRMVKNQLINLANHRKVEQRYAEMILSENIDVSPSQYFMEVDLHLKIEASINALPARRREIFRLSRERGLSYREIAGQLHISVKTVETQMGLALRQLRSDLKEYRHLLIGISIFKK
ncbi:RNA polymerase sigma-70 factor [Mangrovibacterium marinum]|nr:RNA polymerase sigma-70 factor [Mangrovibacterium marinum]